jgi:hypothetical protein
LNVTEFIHLIYAVATVITGEISWTGSYKSETHESRDTPVG